MRRLAAFSAGASLAYVLLENIRLDWKFHHSVAAQPVTARLSSPTHLMLHTALYVVRTLPQLLLMRLIRSHPLGWSIQYEGVVRCISFSSRVGSFGAANGILEAVATLSRMLLRCLHGSEISTKVPLLFTGKQKSHRRVEAAHARWVSPRALPLGGTRAALQRSRGVVLYCHGGGYCVGNAEMYLPEFISLAGMIEAELTLGGICSEGGTSPEVGVLSVEYTLSGAGGRIAPPLCFPRAISDVVAAYTWLIDPAGGNVEPRRVVVSGDSAGGGLAVALLMHIRDHDLPAPAAAILISPWVNHIPTSGDTSSYARFAQHDYLDPSLVALFSAQYRGVAPEHGHVDAAALERKGAVATAGARELLSRRQPEGESSASKLSVDVDAEVEAVGLAPVSPHHRSISAVQSGSRQGEDPCCVRGASFSGFPPCLVFAGGVEIFRDDVEALYSILKAAAPTAGHELFVHENMVHVSPMLGALGSESAVGRRRMASFAATKLVAAQGRKKKREVKDGA